MVDLRPILQTDPTLDAADLALVERSKLEPLRPYLGMSSIGESCSRKLWFRFRWAKREEFDPITLKRFADGHAGEDIIVSRLQAVTTLTHTGKNQKTYTDCDSHLKGHPDGIIEGLLQAPATPHIFEAKVCSEKKVQELRKAKIDLGEKMALRKWNAVYHAQAILYMFYEGLKRHYLVAATAGCREWISVRTESDDKAAKGLIEKARRIIHASNPPEKVSEDETWFECRMCSFAAICHGDDLPLRNCRTCAHSSPSKGGTWVCALGFQCDNLEVTKCKSHVYIPSLVKGEIVASTETSVTYRMKDGNLFKDGK